MFENVEEAFDCIAFNPPYLPEGELVGKKIIIVANLEPRKVRGIESQGMLLAACPEGDFSRLALVSVEDSAEDGWKVY
ncbi:MAG: hypothetical protein AUJ71_03070 [Candidatus Omnitrophica bacterium CG1_02_49_16]|nr:MAG: hypothetical protein AUJ71_03070 [Candidatus Omnitrophica bacterium CG1_02_49_16]